MSKIRMFLAWPLTFVAIWYFLSFQVAVIIGLLLLLIISILLLNLIEKLTDKLVKLTTYITEKDGLIDFQNVDFSNIETGADLTRKLESLLKKRDQ